MALAVNRFTKDEAIREARIGSKLKGGTWYVTRRGSKYGAVPADMHDTRRHGRVAEIIDIHAERAAQSLKCEACKGTGIIAIGDDDGVAPPAGHVFAQRCDQCQMYESDLEAAQAYGQPFTLDPDGRAVFKIGDLDLKPKASKPQPEKALKVSARSKRANIKNLKALFAPMIAQATSIRAMACQHADAAMHANEKNWRDYHVAVEVLYEQLDFLARQ